MIVQYIQFFFVSTNLISEIFWILCFIDFIIFLRKTVLMIYIIINKELEYIVISLIEKTRVQTTKNYIKIIYFVVFRIYFSIL